MKQNLIPLKTMHVPKLLSTFVLVLTSLSLFAQEPFWTDYARRKAKLPESRYLVGFSSQAQVSAARKEDAMEALLEMAKKQLVESVQVTVKSISTMNIENLDSKTLEYFKQSSVSYSNLNISGLKTETYYDAKKQEAFAIAYARRSEVTENYRQTLLKNLHTLESSLKEIGRYFTEENQEMAIKTCFGSQTLFREIEEAQTIIIAMGQTSQEEIKASIEKYHLYQTQVNQYLTQLTSYEKLTLNEVAFYISAGFKAQIGRPVASTQLYNFTYENTQVGSEFSQRLSLALEQKLIQEGEFEIVKPTEYSENFKPLHLITGTYWKEANRLKIVAILRNARNGKAIASMEGYLPLQWLTQNQVDYVPENFQQAQQEEKTFVEEATKHQDFYIDMWTNKGKDGLVFSEGELLKISVNTNESCYLRVIYHLADGSRVLLLDNYYIADAHTNTTYTLPHEFECAAPFGVETLQVNAQTRKFKPLEVEEEYGYVFIQNDLESLLENTRGFVKVKKVKTAEKRLTITTVGHN
ncbi:DUF4384 domain-containing protein [Rapidithrix thailandica]|uniref:DUF4384 domain-containing protein n=1 Tax=Rapidithrix thailandica TaxID=413964 RepID=A0AAW9RPH9_9BACT